MAAPAYLDAEALMRPFLGSRQFLAGFLSMAALLGAVVALVAS